MRSKLRSTAYGASLLLAALLRTPPASAADPLPYGSFEVAPMIGYQLGGNFRDLDTNQHYSLDGHGAFALALDAPADRSSQYELFYGRQETQLTGYGFAPLDVRVEYLHLGGTIPLDEASRARPYLAGGLGATRYTPDYAAGHADTAFSMSLALGLRAPLSRHLSLRMEARSFLTFMNTDTAVFCRSDQTGSVCRITAQGSGQFQFALLAGLSYLF